MDMYTMPLHSVNSFRGTSELNLPIKTSFGPLTPTQTHERDGLCKPLLKAKSLGKDHVPVSTSPMKLSQTSNVTISGLPPPVEQYSFSQAVLNAINVLCGIGILSMPYAFKEGGWLSLVLLMVFGVICCYTGILLKICLEKCHGLQTYPDIRQAAFGYFGRVCIAVSIHTFVFYFLAPFLSHNLSFSLRLNADGFVLGLVFFLCGVLDNDE
ncbi:putative amino acid transporter, transmembrane domain-containing protein [Helianthus annuus]|nr:putative amino acid transporter, transmembrane domain-containing protein [Helianthus annuus]